MTSPSWQTIEPILLYTFRIGHLRTSLSVIHTRNANILYRLYRLANITDSRVGSSERRCQRHNSRVLWHKRANCAILRRATLTGISRLLGRDFNSGKLQDDPKASMSIPSSLKKDSQLWPISNVSASGPSACVRFEFSVLDSLILMILPLVIFSLG